MNLLKIWGCFPVLNSLSGATADEKFDRFVGLTLKGLRSWGFSNINYLDSWSDYLVSRENIENFQESDIFCHPGLSVNS